MKPTRRMKRIIARDNPSEEELEWLCRFAKILDSKRKKEIMWFLFRHRQSYDFLIDHGDNEILLKLITSNLNLSQDQAKRLISRVTTR